MRKLPNTFAVIRTQSTRGPFYQLFQSRYPTDSVCKVERMQGEEQVRSIGDTHFIRDDAAIYSSLFQLQNGSQQYYSYWFLPVVVAVNASLIPVLNFSFKAWLPSPTHRIPIDTQNRVLEIYDQCERRWAGVEHQRNSEDLNTYFPNLSMRPPTPPRRRHSEDSLSTVSDGDEVGSVMTVYPGSHPPGGEFNTLPALPASPAPTQSLHPLYLPERVGHLLIDNAFKGDDSCPITAIPFSELPSITVTSCFHVFESDAIRTWMQDSSQCPVCRCSVTNMVTKEAKN